MEQEFIHGGGKGEMGRHVGRSSALLNRNGLGHHQSAPKRHPEEATDHTGGQNRRGNGSKEKGGGE